MTSWAQRRGPSGVLARRATETSALLSPSRLTPSPATLRDPRAMQARWRLGRSCGARHPTDSASPDFDRSQPPFEGSYPKRGPALSMRPGPALRWSLARERIRPSPLCSGDQRWPLAPDLGAWSRRRRHAAGRLSGPRPTTPHPPMGPTCAGRYRIPLRAPASVGPCGKPGRLSGNYCPPRTTSPPLQPGPQRSVCLRKVQS